MIRSFYNGVSGIKTQSFGMDIWANNISNINNVGFKSSRPEYKSVFYQTLSMGSVSPVPHEVGLGATKQSSALDMREGPLKNTDNNFDFAIEGNGYFGVRDIDNIYYTRAGAFSKDVNGNLVDTHGRFVQGTMNTLTAASISPNSLKKIGNPVDREIYTLAPTDELKLSDTQTNINLPKYLYQNAKPTTFVQIKGNLDSTRIYEPKTSKIEEEQYNFEISDDKKNITITGQVLPTQNTPNPKRGDNVSVILSDSTGKTSTATTTIDADGNFKIENYALDFLDPQSIKISANLFGKQEISPLQKISSEIFAADGSKHLLNLAFEKKLPQEKDSTTWNLTATLLDENGTQLQNKQSEVVFGSNGVIQSGGIINIGSVSVNLNNTSHDGSYNGITSAPNGQKSLNSKKDGFAEGFLEKYYADNSGTIYAFFDNNNQIPIAKLALYHFTNEQGLAKQGGNIYAATANSGNPFFYRNSSGDIFYGATIASNRLEMSNVSLATALTEVITTQKAYTASSKSITTSDEMIQTAIQMKRA